MTAKEGVLRRRGGGGISASLYIRIRLEKFILFFLGFYGLDNSSILDLANQGKNSWEGRFSNMFFIIFHTI